jgi:CDP-glucose 4,6-dehydratase
MTPDFWLGRRVLVTGHTGFKGSWLSLKLAQAGAKVSGIALAPATDPALFTVAGVEGVLERHLICDIRDREALTAAVREIAPEIVLHLAAQPLVRAAYADPVGTFETNVIGLANLLDALAATPGVLAIVNVTTDKVYWNEERPGGYREGDRLGGRDPYAASKACAELVTESWRASFMTARGVALASARAGNVIGGGDWADDRIIPDALRALDKGVPLKVRSPGAVRPWQHVLEPLAGYVALAEALVANPQGFSEAWNFGPDSGDARPVAWVVDYLAGRAPDLSWRSAGDDGPHEAGLLEVDSAKALAALPWRPRWPLELALDRTLEWHRAWRSGEDMQTRCLAQIVEHAAL